MTPEQIKHKQFLSNQSKLRSIEKRINEKESKIGFFNEVVSYNLKEFISPSDFSRVNILRISKANSLEHEIKKAEIFTRCIHSGLNVLVEPICLNKEIRPDILCLDTVAPIAYEIINNEKDVYILKKDEKYPFKIIIISARGTP